jgi:hypothetical protein
MDGPGPVYGTDNRKLAREREIIKVYNEDEHPSGRPPTGKHEFRRPSSAAPEWLEMERGHRA